MRRVLRTAGSAWAVLAACLPQVGCARTAPSSPPCARAFVVDPASPAAPQAAPPATTPAAARIGTFRHVFSRWDGKKGEMVLVLGADSKAYFRFMQAANWGTDGDAVAEWDRDLLRLTVTEPADSVFLTEPFEPFAAESVILFALLDGSLNQIRQEWQEDFVRSSRRPSDVARLGTGIVYARWTGAAGQGFLGDTLGLESRAGQYVHQDKDRKRTLDLHRDGTFLYDMSGLFSRRAHVEGEWSVMGGVLLGFRPVNSMSSRHSGLRRVLRPVGANLVYDDELRGVQGPLDYAGHAEVYVRQPPAEEKK